MSAQSVYFIFISREIKISNSIIERHERFVINAFFGEENHNVCRETKQ
jgi:hypothetical protein